MVTLLSDCLKYATREHYYLTPLFSFGCMPNRFVLSKSFRAIKATMSFFKQGLNLVKYVT
jgi:hypothetical protein